MNTNEWENEFDEKFDFFECSAMNENQIKDFIRSLLSQATKEAREEVVPEFIPMLHRECDMGAAEPCKDCLGRMNINLGIQKCRNNVSRLNSPNK